MSVPTAKAIRTHLASQGVKPKDLKPWATFLTGLDWAIIKPLVSMAINSHAHPALATGMTARTTTDQAIRSTLVAHLEAKTHMDTPCPYCTSPPGWDACPVHRDGAPTTPRP